MTKRIYRGVLIALLFGLACGWLLRPWLGAPSLESKVRQHMRAIALSTFYRDREQAAVDGLKQLGPAGIHMLMDICRRVDSRPRRAWAVAYSWTPPFIRGLLPVPANLKADRYYALDALSRLGPAGRDAMPVFLQVLSNGDRGERLLALYAMPGLGVATPGTDSAVADQLSHPDGEVRRAALSALGDLPLSRRSVWPAVQRALRHPNPDVRADAAAALASSPALRSLEKPDQPPE